MKRITLPASSAPIDGLAEVLSQHLGQRVGIVRDPWAFIAEGFVVDVHASRLDIAVKLSVEDFGLRGADYEKVSKALRAGSLNLMPGKQQESGAVDVRGSIESIITRARMLPRSWGHRVHWGQFVPLAALPDFQAEWAALDKEWHAALDYWVQNYDRLQAQAVDLVQDFAIQTWQNAMKLGNDAMISQAQARNLEAFVGAAVDRMMAVYPAKDEIHERFSLTYEMSMIPMPQLQAEQAAWAEEVQVRKEANLAELRRQAEIDRLEDELEQSRILHQISLEEAKLREKRAMLQEYTRKTRAELEEQKQRVIETFQRGYALDIRQRVHAALAPALEMLASGKPNPRALPALRDVLSVAQALTLDDDAEMIEMLDRMRHLVAGVKGDEKGRNEIEQPIRDLGLLLQASIYALGDAPRTPREMKAPIDQVERVENDPAVLDSRLRNARYRLGISNQTIGEAVVERQGLTPGELRARRSAAMLEE